VRDWLQRAIGAVGGLIKHISRLRRPVFGRVEIKGVVDDIFSPDHGQVAYCYAYNTIVNDARGILARALAGDEGGFVTSVGWGDGATEPAATDEALENEVLATEVISPAAYPTVDSVVFTSTMAPGVGTGQQFSEVGLKSGNGKLFARFTFPPLDKFARLRLTVSWQIVFVR